MARCDECNRIHWGQDLAPCPTCKNKAWREATPGGPAPFRARLIQRRAIDLGAMNVDPALDRFGNPRWPADEQRVSLWMISYDPESDEFSGWSCGGSVPEWTQR